MDSIKLVFHYLSMHLKVSLEYKISFILSTISQILILFVELFTVYSLFSKFQLLSIYNINELLLGFGIVWLGFSFAEMFFRGFDEFPLLIIKGDFDLLLIKPRSIYMQIFGSNICYAKISRVIVSLILVIYSSIHIIDSFNLLRVIMLINMFIGSVIIFLSVFILGASMSFVTIQGLEIINIITNGSKQVSQYPIKIYNKAFRFIFTFIIPIALINYYPISYLNNNSSNLLLLVYPLVSILFLIFSIFIFKLGMNKYSSTGS